MSDSALNEEPVRSLGLQREGRSVPGYFACAREAELEQFTIEGAAVPEFLGPSERKYLETLRFPVRQTTFLLGRLAAKRAISTMKDGASPAEIDILKGVFEHPVLA